MDFLAIPFGKFLDVIYDTLAFRNYGLAIIIFTVIVKLLLLPLTIKQLRSSAKMQEIQPKIQELNKRYKNDKEKLQQETMKLYSEHKYNPLSGCLPLLIQLPILLSLYQVIIRPITFMLGKGQLVPKLLEMVQKIHPISGYNKELEALKILTENPETLQTVSDIIKPEELVNMNFLGLDLGMTPKFDTNLLFGAQTMGTYLPLLILVIVAVGTTYLSTKLTMAKNTQTNNKNAPGSGQMNMLMYMGPVMTLIFSFSLPAGVILYWTAGYVFQIFQQLYVNKHVMNKKEVATK